MAYTYEAPFVNPANSRPKARKRKEIKNKPQKKKRAKKNVWKYDAENTGGPYFSNSQDYPVGPDGKYLGYSIEEIRTHIRRFFSEKRSGGEQLDYIKIVHHVLDELGYPKEKWKRRAILSALSKEMWRRIKLKKSEIMRKKLEEARQAELALGVIDN